MHDLQDYVLLRDRERRQIKPSPKSAHVNVVVFAPNSIELEKSKSFVEANKSCEWHKWKQAMHKEIDAFA